MSDYVIDGEILTDIADAIREKTGESGVIIPEDMPDAISDISGGGSARLPSEYQEVEYLESTGTQYINTGIVASSDLEVIIKGVIIELVGASTGSDVLCGVRSNSLGASRRFMPFSTQNGITIIRNVYGDSSITNSIVGTNTIKFRYNSNGDVSIERNTYALNGNYIPSNNHIFLFASGDDNDAASYYAKGRICFCVIKNRSNNTTLINYIPCYRKSDNEPGMYDLINNVFKPNEGTGSFSIGLEVQ